MKDKWFLENFQILVIFEVEVHWIFSSDLWYLSSEINNSRQILEMLCLLEGAFYDRRLLDRRLLQLLTVRFRKHPFAWLISSKNVCGKFRMKLASSSRPFPTHWGRKSAQINLKMLPRPYSWPHHRSGTWKSLHLSAMSHSRLREAIVKSQRKLCNCNNSWERPQAWVPDCTWFID